MPIFVDHAGMNTLINQDLDLETNTLSENPLTVLKEVNTETAGLMSRGVDGLSNNEGICLAGDIPVGSTLPNVMRVNDFSISCYVKFDLRDNGEPNPVTCTLVDIVETSSQDGVGFSTDFDYSSTNSFLVRIQLHDDKNSNRSIALTATFTEATKAQLLEKFAGQWIHLAVTVEGRQADGSGVTFYYNGFPVAPDTIRRYGGFPTTGLYSCPTVDKIALLSTANEVNRRDGVGIRQVTIHRRVLTIGEVNSIWNKGVPLNDYAALAQAAGDGLVEEYWDLCNEPPILALDFGDTFDDTPEFAISSSIYQEPTLTPTSLTASNALSGERFEKIQGPGYRTSILTEEDYVGYVEDSKKLVALNTHRNGPYGYSSWKQLRTSNNPLSRHKRSINEMSFVTEPGVLRTISASVDARVRDRYSSIYRYTEPVVCQKSFPLIWNVGRHFKDEDGNVDLENPNRFSIVSSYANSQVGFANDEANDLLKFDPDEGSTEYNAIKQMYLENGLNKLDSPLTHWEFLQYRETVFPKATQQFLNIVKTRPNFESFFKSNRIERTTLINDGNHQFGWFGEYSNEELAQLREDTPLSLVDGGDLSPIGYETSHAAFRNLFVSKWALDEDEGFLERLYPNGSPEQSIAWACGIGEYVVNSVPTYELEGFTAEQLRLYYDSFAPVRDVNGTVRPYPQPFRHGEGELMSTMRQFINGVSSSARGENLNTTTLLNGSVENNVKRYADIFDTYMAPGPLYARRTSLSTTASVVAPSGMEIPQTGGLSYIKMFTGGALWEAGSTREIKDSSGNYVSAPKVPFYDTYENYSENFKEKYKNYSIVPEFRMSSQVEDYLTNNVAIELDMLEITGVTSGFEDSSKEKFYETFSNSDFMRQFELIDEDHRDFTNGKVLSLRCKAVKKFLPYEGFYPAQRTVQLVKRFYDSFGDNISFKNQNGVQISDFNFSKQMVLTPLFAPGVLFNTIKSGIAVDYPIYTGSIAPVTGGFATAGNSATYEDDWFLLYKASPDSSLFNFDYRVPFESLVEPERYLANIPLVSNEPHPSGNLSSSAIWDGQGDELYSKMMNNFLAEVPEFFLPNGQLTSVVSKRQRDISLKSGSVYGMRVKMRRSMDGPRQPVYLYNSSSAPWSAPQDFDSDLTGNVSPKETFTMYSRPSAFGPPSIGIRSWGNWPDVIDPDDLEIHDFGDTSNTIIYPSPSNSSYIRVTKNYGSFNGINFPFTPPYYHGEAWCDITLTASSDSMSISEIQQAATYEYFRYDESYLHFSSSSGSFSGSEYPYGFPLGPQSSVSVNNNAVQLSASLNLQGVGKITQNVEGGAAGNLIVDTAIDEDSRWVIQTKFETPMLNFNHISEENGNLSVPAYGGETVPRGMWHQYGRIPEEDEGVFLEVGPIEQNWWNLVKGETNALNDLSYALGFSGNSTKLGRLRSKKTIYEAVVAVPFVEDKGRKKFFAIDKNMVQAYKEGGASRLSLTTGDPQDQIGRSVLAQMQKMERYLFPPSFDFLNNSVEEVEPIAMYIFEFSHVLNQQDLSDIWQNLPPDIATTTEESEVAITHPLLKKELLGQGGSNGNTLINMPGELKWMVFKVKQRAASNYFKKTVVRNPDLDRNIKGSSATVDEFGKESNVQYNWPYDFFSLVELVKIDSEVEIGNFREEDIRNYTNSIPAWNAKQADLEKIEFVVGGLEDNSIPEVEAVEEVSEEVEAVEEVIEPTPEPTALSAQEMFAPLRSAVEGNIMSWPNQGWQSLFTGYRNALYNTGAPYDINAWYASGGVSDEEYDVLVNLINDYYYDIQEYFENKLLAEQAEAAAAAVVDSSDGIADAVVSDSSPAGGTPSAPSGGSSGTSTPSVPSGGSSGGSSSGTMTITPGLASTLTNASLSSGTAVAGGASQNASNLASLATAVMVDFSSFQSFMSTIPANAVTTVGGYGTYGQATQTEYQAAWDFAERYSQAVSNGAGPVMLNMIASSYQNQLSAQAFNVPQMQSIMNHFNINITTVTNYFN